jgi:hypothetical protein
MTHRHTHARKGFHQKKGKRKGFGDDDDADHPASGGKRFKNQEKGKRPKKKSK